MSAVPKQEIEGLVSELPGPKGPGARLKAARLSRKLDVSDIAQAIFVREDQVIAIEEDDYAHLPARVYIVGYMKKYARQVGIPEEAIVKAFNECCPPDANDVHFHKTETDTRGVQDSGVNEKKSGGTFFSKLFLLLILASAGYYAYERYQAGELPSWLSFMPSATVPQSDAESQAVLHKSESITQVALDSEPVASVAVVSLTETPAEASLPLAETELEPVPEEQAEPLVVETVADQIAESPVAEELPVATEEVTELALPASPVESAEPEVSQTAPTAEPLTSPEVAALPEIIVTFSEICWTDIRDSAKTFKYMAQAKPGKVVKLSGTPPFKVLFGNVNGVKMTINGEPFDLERYTNANVARFMLDPSNL